MVDTNINQNVNYSNNKIQNQTNLSVKNNSTTKNKSVFSDSNDNNLQQNTDTFQRSVKNISNELKANLNSWLTDCSDGLKESGGKTVKKGNFLTNIANRAKKWVGDKLNYKIDNLTQGGEGNCALLASIEAVGSRTDASKILQDTVHKTQDGKGVNITFKGAKAGTAGSKEKPIYVSYSQIQNDATKLRNGNSDLEAAAINQAVKQKLGAPPYVPSTTLSLLTGEKSTTISPKSVNDALKKGSAVVAHINNHAWKVVGYKNGNLILSNPHNTSKLEVRSTDGLVAIYATVPKT